MSGRALGLSIFGLDIPNPLAWINEQVLKWLGIPKRLGDAINKVIPIYSTAQDPRIRASAKYALDRLGELAQDYTDIERKLVYRESLGALPIIVGVLGAVSVISVAWAMASIFRRTTAAEEAARAAADLAAACAAGRISCEAATATIDGLSRAIEAAPEEKGVIAEVAGQVGGAVKLAVMLALGWGAAVFLGPVLRRRQR